MNKKILITGSSGFLGEEIVNFFSKDNPIIFANYYLKQFQKT